MSLLSQDVNACNRYHRNRGFSCSKILASTTLMWLCLLPSLTGTATAPPKPQPFRIKGSYVIAAVCRNGIIVASDSRGMLKDGYGRRIAYYDVNQKIFPIGRSLIADTGYASLNDPHTSFLSALMAQFEQSPGSHINVDQLPDSYFNYVNRTLSAQGAESAKVQTLVFAGFKQTEPTLCIYRRGSNSNGVKCRSSGYLSSPQGHIAGLENVGTLSFEQAAKVMQKEIEDYAAAVQPGLVGGPVVIRVITRSDSAWWGQPPRWPKWNSFSDLAEDYRAGLVPFHLMPGASKAELDELIAQGAAWARLRRDPSSSQ